jgi:hypothetical protein
MLQPLMSNHYHMVVTDPQGQLCTFLARFHKEFAKCINTIIQHRESVFAPNARPHHQRLVHAKDVATAIAYSLANPAASGICERAADWPGVIVGPDDLLGTTLMGSVTGIPYLAERDVTRLALPIVPPPQVAEVGGAVNFAREVRKRVAAAEEKAPALPLPLDTAQTSCRSAFREPFRSPRCSAFCPLGLERHRVAVSTSIGRSSRRDW